jgi:NADH dehydrogenase FAD-containing subunit
MASIMPLGSAVTLVEVEGRILPGRCEMSAYLARMLKRQKIKIMIEVRVTEVTRPEIKLPFRRPGFKEIPFWWPLAES